MGLITNLPLFRGSVSPGPVFAFQLFIFITDIQDKYGKVRRSNDQFHSYLGVDLHLFLLLLGAINSIVPIEKIQWYDYQ